MSQGLDYIQIVWFIFGVLLNVKHTVYFILINENCENYFIMHWADDGKLSRIKIESSNLHVNHCWCIDTSQMSKDFVR